MDNKTKARIINAARKLSRWHKPRLAAKKKAQVDKALFLCSSCGTLCYEGKSQIRFFEYKEKYRKYRLVMEAPHMDHIVPVVDPEAGFPYLPDGWPDFNTYFRRMFSDENNFIALCQSCHKTKTIAENQIRKQNRKKINKKSLTKARKKRKLKSNRN
jgi:5-methylcytosine-specific restriction endonuclease McrA